MINVDDFEEDEGININIDGLNKQNIVLDTSGIKTNIKARTVI